MTEKKQRLSLLIRGLVLGSCFLLMALQLGCSFSYPKQEFEKGQKALDEENYKEALSHFDRIVKKDPDSELALPSARHAARIAFHEVKDFPSTIDYLKYLILHSKSSEERLEAQKKLAIVYFEKLLMYEKAIEEYNKLLNLNPTAEEEFNYRFNISKSYFQLNNFFQSEIELNSLLEKFDDLDKQFDVQLFKGNLFLTTKEHEKAILTFEEIMKKFPEKASKENIALSLAAVYEDLQQFDKAVEILKELRMSEQSPEFIDLKIKRLQDRAQNLPGAQGFRK